MKRTVKKLTVLTIAACLLVSICAMSKNSAFAGSMAWVASVDPQMGGLPVYAEASENAGLVGSLPRCAQVALTGNEQASLVEISQPMAGWVQSNLLSQNALLCSQRSVQPVQTQPGVSTTSAPQPSVSTTSVEPVEVQYSVSGASYGLGPEIGFSPGGGWGPQGHWEPGHWVPGHREGGWWIPGRWADGRYIPGHWVGGHWEPGHYEPGHWAMHNGHSGNHPISLTKGNSPNKFKSLALNKAKSTPKLKSTSINKQKLGTLGKMNSKIKFGSLKSASFKSASSKGGSFKGGFAHGRR